MITSSPPALHPPPHADDRLGVLLALVSDDVWECDAGLCLSHIHDNSDKARAPSPLVGHLGRGVEDWADPARPPEDFPRLLAAMARRQPFRDCAVPILAPDGGEHWLRLGGHPLFDPEGRFTGYLGTAARITGERRRLAAERHRQQVESLGQLARGVAHEFNNLLVPITMLSKLALPLAGGDQTLRLYLTTIHENGWQAAMVIRDILTATRGLDPSSQPVPCGALVAERIRLLRRIIPPSVSIESDIADQTTLVSGTASELSQIVINLFNNACDAMDGDGTIRCAVRRVTLAPEDGRLATPDAILIEVSDTGPGIPPALHHRVFEPFFTTKPVGRGTGLGLTVVDGLIRDRGGHIAISEAPGLGARITILLPVAPEAERDP